MSKYPSRVVEPAQPGARRSAANNSTSYLEPSSEEAIDFHWLFFTHYRRIRESCLEFAEAGLAIFAISELRGWAGTMFLASPKEGVNVGVVGRHSEADLYLDDPSIALRHLVFLVAPRGPQGDAVDGMARFRVLDLNTGSPPIDEEGRAVESLTATGPVFLGCQGHAIMAFVTGDPGDWPASAEDAWSRLPDRVFMEEDRAPSAHAEPPTPDARAPRMTRVEPRRATTIRRESGPAHVATRQDAGDEPVFGQLIIASLDRMETLRIGRESLRRGLLVGRYDRCDAGRTAIEDPGVSRVHVLIIESDGLPYAIDLGSTNGTLCTDSSGTRMPFRVLPLCDGDRMGLGGATTYLVWSNTERSPPDLPAARAAGVDRHPSSDIRSLSITPADFLRQQPGYLEGSVLERQVWDCYYIPLALAVSDRGGSVTFDEAARLLPFPSGPLASIARAMNPDELGIFDNEWTARQLTLRSDVCVMLKALSGRHEGHDRK